MTHRPKSRLMRYEKLHNARIPKIRGWNVRNFQESHDDLVDADDQIWGPETRNFDELNPRKFSNYFTCLSICLLNEIRLLLIMVIVNITMYTYICVGSDCKK